MNQSSTELFTRSYDKQWNRIVHLKEMGQEEASCLLSENQSCKLLLFEKGSGVIEVNHQLLHITAPTVVCINQIDNILIHENHSFLYSVLFFRPTTLNDAFSYEFLSSDNLTRLEGSTLYQDLILLNTFYGINQHKRTLIMLSSPSFAIVKSLFQKINLELVEQKDGFWPCRSRSFFIELLFFLEGTRQENYERETEIPAWKNNNRLVHDIISYLSRNINHKVSLEELEREFGTNRNKINSEFQKEMNTTVMKYFVLLRMQLAANIIRDTEIPITEVALRVGYFDVGHFSRTFKEIFHKTPREYHASRML